LEFLPLSHSPDVLHHLTALICGYLCKEGDSITWGDLRDEVDKATSLLQTKKKVCLVLVALGFGGELKSAVTNSGDPLGLRVSVGSWSYQDKKLQLLPRRNTRAATYKTNEEPKVVLTLPNGMELLVLSDGSLRRLLGAKQLLALRELIDLRLNPEKLSLTHNRLFVPFFSTPASSGKPLPISSHPILF
jgi:hypothetical protein